MKLFFLLLALCFSVKAQESYVDSVVSTTQVTSTHVTAGGISSTNVSTTGNVSANKFIGDGSFLTGLTTSPSWYAVQNIPAQVQAVSTSGNISLSNVDVSGTVSATRLAGTGVSISAIINQAQPIACRDPNLTDDVKAGFTPSDTWVNFCGKRAWQNVANNAGAAAWEQIDYLEGPVVDAVSATAAKPVRLAVGTRALLSSFGSSLLRVVRTDGISKSIVQEGQSWMLDMKVAKAFCSNTTCKVNLWFDQSGNSNNVSQTTGANQPIFNYQNMDGLPVITFDGANHMTDSANSPRMGASAGTCNQASCTILIVGRVFGNNAVSGIFEVGHPTNVLNAYTNYGPQFTPSLVSGTAWNWPSYPSVFGMVLKTSATTLFANDRLLTVSDTFASTNATGVNFGTNYAFGGFPAALDMYAAVVYGGALTDAEFFRARVAAYINFGIVPQVRTHFVEMGDSIAYGWASANNTTGLFVARNLAVQNVGAWNQSIPGSHIYDLQPNFPSLTTNVFQASQTYNVLLDPGRNDITEGVSPTQMYNSLTIIINNIRSSFTTVGVNPLSKILVGTIPATSGTNGTTEANRVTYNNKVVSNTAGADLVVDFASSPLFGSSPAPSRTDLYSDGIHATARTHSARGEMIYNGLRPSIK